MQESQWPQRKLRRAAAIRPIQEKSYNTNVPVEHRKAGRCYYFTTRHQLFGHIGKLVKRGVSVRKPGILDRISTCESSEAAHTMWFDFLDTANAVSQKTINKAVRLLKTLDFPLP